MLLRKKDVAVGLCSLALIALSGVAYAETRLAVQDSTGTTDKMVVTDQGYIGVGTNAPKAAMQTKGDTSPKVQIISHYTGTELLNGGGFLAYKNHPDGSLPLKDERVGYMLFGSYTTDGLSNRNGGGLLAYADADWSNASTPTSFAFETAPAGTYNRAERMRITNAGNVGIGTKTPTQKLEVNGAIRLNTATARPTNCTSSLRGVLYFSQNNTSGQADTIEICMKNANGAYVWAKIQ